MLKCQNPQTCSGLGFLRVRHLWIVALTLVIKLCCVKYPLLKLFEFNGKDNIDSGRNNSCLPF